MPTDKPIPEKDLIAAHRFCTANREMLEQNSKCACFYCKRIFDPKKITEWIDDRDGQTAVCPYCYIDSVIGESAGYPLSGWFIEEMHRYWFM